MTQLEYIATIKEVNRLRNQIHIFNNDEISEQALDDLKHQITIFETNNPNLIDKNSPNYIVAGGILKGFKKAIYTGFPTIELARIIIQYVLPNQNLRGVYQVSSNPISKFELLKLIAIFLTLSLGFLSKE